MPSNQRAAAAVLPFALLLGGCSGWLPDDSQPAQPSPEASDRAPTFTLVTGPKETLHGDAAWVAVTRLADHRSPMLRTLLANQQQISGSSLVAGNDLTLLIDGPRTYEEIYAAIDAAEQYVHLESFIVADDEVGQQLRRRLNDAVARGVAVRLLFDGLGSVNTADGFFGGLRAAGIEVREYNPPNPTRNLAFGRINQRTHRKLAIIDGSTAFLGGINFSGVYESASTSAPGPEAGVEQGWRDTHLRVGGPVVADFAHLFGRNWAKAGGELPQSLRQPARSAATGPYLVSALMSDGGDDDEFAIYQSYLNAINLAERRIWLTRAYFSPNKAFLQAIEQAARRGVDVRLLLPGFIDFEMIRYASRSSYARLLDAGVRIYERNDALLHAKTAVVDGVWATVGSANLDIRSFAHNDEVNAVIVGSEFGRQMEEQFTKDLDQAREIDAGSWRQRPWRSRFLEWFSRRFNYWL